MFRTSSRWADRVVRRNLSRRRKMRQDVTEALEAFAAEETTAHRAMQAYDLGVVRIPYVVIGLVVLSVLAVFVLSKMPDTGAEHERIALGPLVHRLATPQYQLCRCLGGRGRRLGSCR